MFELGKEYVECYCLKITLSSYIRFWLRWSRVLTILYLNTCIEWAVLSLKLIKKMLECMQDVCILVAHFIKLLVLWL